MKEKETPQSSSAPAKRNLVRTVLSFVLAVGVPAAGIKAGCVCMDASEAKTVKGQTDKLVEVKTFLDANSAKLKTYASLSPQDMAKHAPAINTILVQTIDEMKKARSVADEIGKTHTRFNPLMFAELDIALDLAIRKISPGNAKINRLNQEANQMYLSSEGWGILNAIVREQGIDPDAVKYMAYLIKQLRKCLTELKASVTALENDQIRGSCSNNYFVDKAISKRYGPDHCYLSNSPFCKAIAARTAIGDFDLNRINQVQVVALQRELISEAWMDKDGDDGVLGPHTQASYMIAKDTDTFKAEVEKCKK